MFNKINYSSGFTFIELLVAITIMTVMIGIATISFRGANANARDTKRKAELEDIRGAIETYRLENGAYPTEEANSFTQAIFMDEIYPEYINRDFEDPKNNATYNYQYHYVGNAACNYVLVATMEVDNNAQSCPAGCYSAGSGDYCLAN